MADKSTWKHAHIQAVHIPKIKNKQAKDHQIVLLCETLKKELKGGK